MDKKFLVDTNIIIYYLDNQIPPEQVEKVERIFKTSFYISTITKIELLGWKKISQEDIQKIEKFIQPATILYVDEAVQNRAIVIKQQYTIKTPDAIIGATALLYRFTLVSRNASDFKAIAGLNLYNPFAE